jgi:hypothetical protein
MSRHRRRCRHHEKNNCGCADPSESCHALLPFGHVSMITEDAQNFPQRLLKQI